MLFHDRKLCNYLVYQLIHLYIYILTENWKDPFLLLINVPTRYHVRHCLGERCERWCHACMSCMKMETENSCCCISKTMQRNVFSNAFFLLRWCYIVSECVKEIRIQIANTSQHEIISQYITQQGKTSQHLQLEKLNVTLLELIYIYIYIWPIKQKVFQGLSNFRKQKYTHKNRQENSPKRCSHADEFIFLLSKIV